MCGIYGIFGRTRETGLAMASMRHRGPDKQGHWSDDAASIWLGHARLSIIDLSPAGDQPMISPDGRFVMVYNGEIYNYRELRHELEAQGETFVGHSDSEVFLRLFARDGADCFDRLNGIFAAAFWDRQTDTLTLVRDQIGVKPLYYAEQPHGFVFASELKTMVASGDLAPTVDPKAVLHHLGLLWSPGRNTIASEVKKLLPGEAMTIRDRKVTRRWRYSRLGMPKPAGSPRLGEAEAISAVRDAVEEAVKRQMVADVPLGSFLSGGLDSSAVAVFAARHHSGPGKLQCFTMELEGTAGEGFADDLPYAKRVAQHLDVDLHVLKASPSLIERLPEMIRGLDEPTADFAALNTLLISEFARTQGMTVLLSGTGGDDVFTGYRRHYALTMEKWWSWAPQPARALLSAATARLPQRSPAGRRITKAFAGAARPLDERLAAYFFWLGAEDALQLLSPDFRGQLTAEDMAAPLLETLGEVGGASPLDRLLYLEKRHFLADHNLNYADKMGMAASIEIRVPLLDRDLIELSLSLPDHLKQRGSVGKWVFKKAMEPYLPHDVIYRPKTGFGAPLRQWLLGPLAGVVSEVLAPSRLAARGIFDPAAVAAMVKANQEGRKDASYTIFAVLCIELWCQTFIDGHGIGAQPDDAWASLRLSA